MDFTLGPRLSRLIATLIGLAYQETRKCYVIYFSFLEKFTMKEGGREIATS
jgi:hypothetical protein